jgi:hypothetical protein
MVPVPDPKSGRVPVKSVEEFWEESGRTERDDRAETNLRWIGSCEKETKILLVSLQIFVRSVPVKETKIVLVSLQIFNE